MTLIFDLLIVKVSLCGILRGYNITAKLKDRTNICSTAKVPDCNLAGHNLYSRSYGDICYALAVYQLRIRCHLFRIL